MEACFRHGIKKEKGNGKFLSHNFEVSSENCEKWHHSCEMQDVKVLKLVTLKSSNCEKL